MALTGNVKNGNLVLDQNLSIKVKKSAVKYADEIIVLSKGVQDYFSKIYGRETCFIPNGVNRPKLREAEMISKKVRDKQRFLYFVSGKAGTRERYSVSS